MPDLIGKTLGDYRIIEQVGLGGMATVFKAYQPSMDRYVAFKVISTHLTQDPAFVQRFQQEAKVIARLEHLHILPVYDYGEVDGYLYPRFDRYRHFCSNHFAQQYRCRSRH
jgi:serine/threonine protein kinase